MISNVGENSKELRVSTNIEAAGLTLCLQRKRWRLAGVRPYRASR